MQHIHKLGLENFRLFKELQEFYFAPITLLTGVNNSGKSSVIKSLLLLKESYNKSLNLSDLLFTESKINLGSFKQCTYNQNKNRQFLRFKFQFLSTYFNNDCSIEFEYKPNSDFAENGTLRAFRILFKDKELLKFERKIELEESERLKPYDGSDYIHHIVEFKINLELVVELLGAKYCIKTNQNLSEEDLQKRKERIDLLKMGTPMDDIGLDLLWDELESKKSIFYNFFIDPIKFPDNKNESVTKNGNLFLIRDKVTGEICIDEQVNDELQQKILNRPQPFSIYMTGDEPDLSTPTVLDLYLRYIESFNSIENVDFDINISQEIVFSDFGKFVFSTVLKDSVKDAFSLFREATKSIYSLSSLRGNTERLYSNNSDIVDINNIIIQLLESNVYSHSAISKFINKSLMLFNIGDKLSIDRHQGVASEVFIHRGAQKKLLADLGFGYTQLLPVILKIAIIAKENCSKEVIPFAGGPYSPSVMILEEPESNLHPSYQSKLADLIIDAASNFNIQFIIETHSEYLVRKFQYLVAIKGIKPRDISLYYFYEPNSIPKGEKQVKKIELLEGGRLSEEFGSGFFDEADNLAVQLFISNKNTSN